LFPVLFFIQGCNGDNGATDAGTDDGAEGVTILYETCPPCENPPSCRSGEVLTCCTCIKLPLENALRTSCSDMSDFCGSGSVDISCFRPGGYPPTDLPPQYVTLHGIVDVYATGPDSNDITIEVYTVNEDSTLGTLLGSTLSTADCAAHESQLPAHHEIGDELTFCPGICREKKPDTEDCRDLAYYSINGIPTNTPLVVKTTGSAGTWKDMIQYNIWFFDDAIQDGKVFHKARCLSLDDWRNIPVAAGDVGGVAPGKSAVAGEIHDCGDIRVYYVTVGTNPRAATFTYFNGVEEKLYPELGRGDYGTNLDSLYAAVEMDAGQTVWVTAVAQIPGEGYVSLGWGKARTFPDSLTSVTLKGMRPDQVP